MARITGLVLCLVSFPLTAQKLYIYPKTAIAPRGTYQSVTAIITGASDKSVTWSASGGKIVGSNPCVVNEPCTIALYSAEAGKYALKATSNADHSISAISNITFSESPKPATSHPRLMIDAAMLPQLRAKATSKNVMYQSLRELARAAMERDKPLWNWTCNGGSGQVASDQSQSFKENDAYLFALMSEIAPTQQERDQWGCHGHDVFMTMAGYVLGGQLNLGAGNHWADSAGAFTLTPDWLMGGGYISSGNDLNTIRKYLAKIAYAEINNIYNGTLAVIGSYNSPDQFQRASEWSATSMRAMGNNYTQSRVLYLIAASLTFDDDPTDDPPLANTCKATRYQVCPDGTAGSLHAYWRYVSGGLLYKDWANMEDPNVVLQAYNAAFHNLPTAPMCMTAWRKPIPCLGGGRGGESSEGTSYGASLGRLRVAMNAAHTAGYDDPLLYGPQMSIGTMSYWDLRYVADLTLLTGLSGVPSENSRWNFLTNGDSAYYFTYPSNYSTEASMLTATAYTSETDRFRGAEWLLANTAFGMADGHAGKCQSYCGINAELGNDYGSGATLDLFLALPGNIPVTNDSAADPRPSMPTEWYDAGNQHLVVRDGGWKIGANTIFSYYCTNTQIDHEHQFCGGFDLYSNGEYITKGRMEFNNYNDEMSTARNKNIPPLIQYPGQKWCTPEPWCTFNQAATDGGQFWHGYQAGLSTLYHAELPGYVAAIAEDHNAYNAGEPGYVHFNGITAASRSLIYLRGSNEMIYYDRGATGSNAWDKANYIVSTGAPTFNGNTASWSTRSGHQKVYWIQLQPGQAPALETIYKDNDAQSDWEIYGRIKADAGKVPSATFLSVLEWGAASLTPARATLVTSSSGNGFDGALVGSSLVMFMRSWPAAFTGVTYPASGATKQYVSDLTPNTSYSISAAGAPPTARTDAAGVLAFSAAGTGNITIAGSH